LGYPKYDDYNYPVVLLDSDLDVIYKNEAAKFVNIKPRIGMNMKKYTDARNYEKLRDILNNGKVSTVTLNVQSPIKCCTARGEKAGEYKDFEKDRPVVALIFFDSLNFFRDDAGVIDKINAVIDKYGEQERKLAESIGLNGPGLLNAAKDMISGEFAEEAGDIEYTENYAEYAGHSGYGRYKYYENNKKILRIREHFRRHVLNLKPNAPDGCKNYCDIGLFMRNFEDGISSCINNLGYKINFAAEDKMFLHKLNERDFLTVNFILASFAFEHSVFNKISVKFFADIYMTGVLRYEFSVPGDFADIHGDMFSRDYLENIGGIEYLDLALAALIAQNNDLRLSVKFSGDNGSKVYLDLIFGEKSEVLLSPPPCAENYGNIITADFISEKAEIEFSWLTIFADKPNKANKPNNV